MCKENPYNDQLEQINKEQFVYTKDEMREIVDVLYQLYVECYDTYGEGLVSQLRQLLLDDKCKNDE